MKHLALILLLAPLAACTASNESVAAPQPRSTATVEAVSPTPTSTTEPPRGLADFGRPGCDHGSTRYPIHLFAPSHAGMAVVIDLDNGAKVALRRTIPAKHEDVWFYTVLDHTLPDTVVTVRQGDAVLASRRARDICR